MLATEVTEDTEGTEKKNGTGEELIY